MTSASCGRRSDAATRSRSSRGAARTTQRKKSSSSWRRAWSIARSCRTTSSPASSARLALVVERCEHALTLRPEAADLQSQALPDRESVLIDIDDDLRLADEARPGEHGLSVRQQE